MVRIKKKGGRRPGEKREINEKCDMRIASKGLAYLRKGMRHLLKPSPVWDKENQVRKERK